MTLEVNEVSNYLTKRGYDVGYDASGFSVNGIRLTDYQMSVLATYEACKDEDAEPDGLALGYMAEACLKISQHPSTPSLAADEGRDLAKRLEEWKNPEVDVPIAQTRVLCKRMAHFLTSWFGFLWPPQESSGLPGNAHHQRV